MGGGVAQLVRVKASDACSLGSIPQGFVKRVVRKTLATVPQPQIRGRREAVDPPEPKVAVQREIGFGADGDDAPLASLQRLGLSERGVVEVDEVGRPSAALRTPST